MAIDRALTVRLADCLRRLCPCLSPTRLEQHLEQPFDASQLRTATNALTSRRTRS